MPYVIEKAAEALLVLLFDLSDSFEKIRYAVKALFLCGLCK